MHQNSLMNVDYRRRGRNVITQSSTNQIHSAEISRISSLYVCKLTRPSSSMCEGLVSRLCMPVADYDTCFDYHKSPYRIVMPVLTIVMPVECLRMS